MLTQKATRATIKLGGIELNCYQMPDGTYRYSQTNAFISIADEGYDTQQAAKRYIQKTTSKQAQTIVPQGFGDIQKVKIEGENHTFNAISQADVSNLWLLFAMDGNVKAVSLLGALAQEALERRADTAFGVKRSEEERNDRLEARIDHADGWRKNFTDWQKLDGCEVGLDYALRVKQLKAFGGLPIDISIKDYDSKQVKKMTNCEVIYDAMRRKGLTHDEALRSL